MAGSSSIAYQYVGPPHIAGVHYKLEATVRFTSGDCGISFSSSNIHLSASTYELGLGSWTALEGHFLANAAPPVHQMVVTCSGVDGAVDVDNIRVTEVSPTVYSASSPHTGVNLVSNPGFESGTTGYIFWHTHGPTQYSVASNVGEEGSMGAVYGVPAQDEVFFELGTIFPGEIGKVHLVSLRISASRETKPTFDSECNINIDFRTATSRTRLTSIRPTILANEWITIETFGLVTGPNVRLALDFECASYSTSNTIYVDNVSVYKAQCD